jgi:rRNA-processing protein FCF1
MSSGEKRNKSEDGYDIFIANTTYPEAKAIFSHVISSVNEIVGDCLIVIDTNALLVPYKTGKESLEQIRKTYESLTKADRLFIPGQVAREFARNRAEKITELFQQFSRKRDSFQRLQRGNYPLLDSFPEYQEVIRLEKEIDSSIRKYQESLGEVLNHIREWKWDDPVSKIYRDLFNSNTIIDIELKKEELLNELKRRRIHKIPPGYKDSTKDDDGIGDLLIWYTILEIGKIRNSNVIFVSGEEKSDWWHKSEGETLYPRHELTDEYRRSSLGKSFHIIPFSQFLALFGASKDVVQEVKLEEIQVRPDSRPISANGLNVFDFFTKIRHVEQSVFKWVASTYSYTNMSTGKDIFNIIGDRSMSLDLVFIDENSEINGVEVAYLDSKRLKMGNFSQRIREKSLNGYYGLKENKIQRYIFVIVFDTIEDLLFAKDRFVQFNSRFPSIIYILGVLQPSGEFEAFSGFTDL